MTTMKIHLLLALLFLCAVPYTQVRAQDTVTDTLTALVSGEGYHKPIAGLAAVRLKKGEIAYSFAKRNPGINTHSPFDENSLFRIASVSKLVTAIGVMQLVEQGKIALDEDVSLYLGFTLRNPHFPMQKITTRMLLSHTSGILDGQRYSIGPQYSLKEFFFPSGKFWEKGAHFADKNAQNGLPLGQFFHYANLNFGVLGTLIERVSGQRFDRFMQASLFEPMEIDAAFNVRLLTDGGFNKVQPLFRKQADQWVAQVDNYQGIRPGNVVRIENPDTTDTNSPVQFELNDYQVGTNVTFFSPQGGLRISILDLSKLAKMLINDGRYDNITVLKPETVADMEKTQWRYNGMSADTSNGDTYYGLMQEYGLSVHYLTGRTTTQGGDTPFKGYTGGLYGHTGEAYGLLSGFFYDGENGDGYIYAITGTPELAGNEGRYSSFYSWEEAVLSSLKSVDE